MFHTKCWQDLAQGTTSSSSWASGGYPELQKQGELMSCVSSEKRASGREGWCICIPLAVHSARLPTEHHQDLAAAAAAPAAAQESMLAWILALLPGSSL